MEEQHRQTLARNLLDSMTKDGQDKWVIPSSVSPDKLQALEELIDLGTSSQRLPTLDSEEGRKVVAEVNGLVTAPANRLSHVEQRFFRSLAVSLLQDIESCATSAADCLAVAELAETTGELELARIVRRNRLFYDGKALVLAEEYQLLLHDLRNGSHDCLLERYAERLRPDTSAKCLNQVFKVAHSREHDRRIGKLFKSVHHAIAFAVEETKTGKKVTIWAKRDDEDDWFKVISVRKKGEGVVYETDYFGDAVRLCLDPDESPGGPLRTQRGGQVAPVFPDGDPNGEDGRATAWQC